MADQHMKDTVAPSPASSDMDISTPDAAYDVEKLEPTDLAMAKNEVAASDLNAVPTKPPVNPMMDPSSFPDGGTKAWLTVAGAAACTFVSWGWINCIGVFQDYYMREPLREYSPSQVGWIPALETFFMLAMGPVSGTLYDNYGPRWLLIVGTFMHVFGLMMTSISTKYYQFLLAQGVCSAIGANFIFAPSVSAVSTWFLKKRGMAIGLASAGSSLGGVLFPIIVSHMIDEVGFGWAMRTCAFLILGLMIFANLTVRSRLPPRPRRFSLIAIVKPVREAKTAITVAASFCFFWGIFPVFTFISARAISTGMSVSMSYYIVSILNAGSVFGRTLPGILGDRFGRFNIMFAFCTFTSIIIFALWIPGTSSAAQIVFAVLFGFGSGAAIGLTPALIAQISPIQEIGLRIGTVFAFGSIGALTGPPIGGKLITDDDDRFLYLQIFAGVVSAAGSILFLVGRIIVGGPGLKTKV